MAAYGIPFWKKAPFVRLLLAMVAGILLEWYFGIDILTWCVVSIVFAILIGCFFYLPLFNRYRFRSLNGVAVCILFASIGALLAWFRDIRHNDDWFGHFYKPSDALIVTLDEPPVEKTKSVKAIATVLFLHNDIRPVPVKGKIILYFKKDSSLPRLSYGSTIIFKKPLQEIRNSGNPGAFDYRLYSLFHGITHQVYLDTAAFEILPFKKEKKLNAFVYRFREHILSILRKNITGDRELGLAEALLIGYKDDLDQTLVQSYTNTGVVHVIAISGLHLGLVYWLLVQLFRPLQQKKLRWMRLLLIIAGLWLFSLLAGAQPSVLRSALMFTCIAAGEGLTRKTSILNTLACSAFILLCINPYWLWDVGFQLSYAAVLSIIVFMRPIYNWFYFKNKLLDFFWKLNAVTLAAQILTMPVSIYHFHQFPNYFLLTNFVAVPLSSLILFGEIILCAVSFIPAIAGITGRILGWLIRVMNTYIERVEALPFSLWDGLQLNITQALLLLLLSASTGYWLIEKSIKSFRLSLFVLLAFIVLRSWSFIITERQQKIIVYNIAQKQAIDFIDGRQYYFKGDSSLLGNNFARNFHLKPSRILYRLYPSDTLNDLIVTNNGIRYGSCRVLLIDKSITYTPLTAKQTIDLLVVSKNPSLYITKLASSFDIKQVVFDGAASAWKLKYWKRDCDSLGIPYHDVKEQGAFVMNLR